MCYDIALLFVGDLVTISVCENVDVANDYIVIIQEI